MRALALIALLLPLTAEAGMLGGGKGLVRARTSPVAARYVPRVGQAFVGERGEAVTVTRASAKSCLAGGVWISVAANQPCIGDAGLSVEGSRQNVALYSADTSNSGAWSDVSSSGLSATSAGEVLTFAAAVDGAGEYSMRRQSVTGVVGTAYTLSLEVKAGTITGSLPVSMSGTAYFAKANCTLGAEWSRCSVTGTTDNVSIKVNVGAVFSESQTLAAGTVYVRNVQVEAGASASSYIATTTTPVTRQADVLSVPIPAGALWAVYTLNGTRTALDLTGNTTPLTIGVGHELAITGNVTNLTFCYSPDSAECQ